MIELVQSGNWTIRGAALETGIKLCTAKYIVYRFRRAGKLFKKNRGRARKDVEVKIGENSVSDEISK